MNDRVENNSSQLNLRQSAAKAIAYTLLLLVALFSLLYGLQKYAATKPTMLQSTSQSTRLYAYPKDYKQATSQYYTYLVDTFPHITIWDAVHFQERGLFNHWKKPTVPFNLGMNSKDVWFYLPVENESTRDLCLVWHLPNTLDTAQLFWKEKDTIFSHPLVSYFAPLQERALPLRALFDTLWLHPGEHRELYLHLWKNHYNTYVPMVVSPLPELMEQEGFLAHVYSAYMAVFVFIILFNLFLFASLRDPIHLWYPLFIASISMMLLLDAFYDVFLFPPFFHQLFARTETIPFVNFIMVGSGRTMQLLLQQNRSNSIFYKPLLWLFVADIFWGVLQLSYCSYSLLSSTPYPFFVLHTLSDIIMWTSAFLICASIIERIIQKHPLAVIYLATSLLPALGLMNYYLSTLGITGVQFLYPNSVAVGVLLEITMLTFLLTQRYNRLQKDKNQLLQQQLVLQKEMTDRVAEVQENEQRRIASDLHDGLGSFLTALRMMVNKRFHYFEDKGQQEPAETMHTVQQQIDKAMDDIRSISHNLMPKDFEQNEFSQTIKNHLTAISTTTQVKVEYHIDQQVNKLPKDIQLTLFRIFTELMTNALKHARCENITVQFIMDDRSLQLMVEDDGKGFDARETGAGLGLKNIRSRVDYLRGNLSVDSGDNGSILIIDIPIL